MLQHPETSGSDDEGVTLAMTVLQHEHMILPWKEGTSYVWDDRNVILDSYATQLSELPGAEGFRLTRVS